MLVLTRLKDEKVVVFLNGEPLMTVTLVEIRGEKKARLGFEAPMNVEILREEVIPPHRSAHAK